MSRHNCSFESATSSKQTSVVSHCGLAIAALLIRLVQWWIRVPVDGRERVYRRRQERFAAKMKCHDAGCNTGRTDLLHVNGNLNAQQYCDERMQPHIVPKNAEWWHNVSKWQCQTIPDQTAILITTFLQTNAITVNNSPLTLQISRSEPNKTSLKWTRQTRQTAATFNNLCRR